MPHKGPALTVDCVLFDRAGRLLLIRRKNPPFQGHYALPGGFVDVGETVEAAALRELREETGMEAEIEALVGVYSDPSRDPRGHTVSVVFLVKALTDKPVAGDDASEAAFVADYANEAFAFDHGKVVQDALKLVQARTAR